MEIYSSNTLKLTAENEDALKKAKSVIQSQIENEEVWGCTTIQDVFDKTTQLHIVEMEFDSWSAPFEAYAELQAVEGIAIEATLTNARDCYSTRYRWTGEGCNLVAVETTLSDWRPDHQDPQDSLKAIIPSLQKKRHSIDVTINTLRSVVAEAQKRESLS